MTLIGWNNSMQFLEILDRLLGYHFVILLCSFICTFKNKNKITSNDVIKSRFIAYNKFDDSTSIFGFDIGFNFKILAGKF